MVNILFIWARLPLTNSIWQFSNNDWLPNKYLIIPFHSTIIESINFSRFLDIFKPPPQGEKFIVVLTITLINHLCEIRACIKKTEKESMVNLVLQSSNKHQKQAVDFMQNCITHHHNIFTWGWCKYQQYN